MPCVAKEKWEISPVGHTATYFKARRFPHSVD